MGRGYSFYDLAMEALQAADRPLTRRELWDLAVKLGLDAKLRRPRGDGRFTPWDSLGAKLYVLTKNNPNGEVVRIGGNPSRFWLRTKMRAAEE